MHPNSDRSPPAHRVANITITINTFCSEATESILDATLKVPANCVATYAVIATASVRPDSLSTSPADVTSFLRLPAADNEQRQVVFVEVNASTLQLPAEPPMLEQ